MVKKIAACIAALFLAACAVISPDNRTPPAELAPGGTLRAGIMYTNPVVAARDAATGELRGIAVDLARELARKSGLPLELVGYETAARMLGDLNANKWDIAFTGVDADGEGDIAFAQPYIDSDGTFLVNAASTLRSIAYVDREARLDGPDIKRQIVWFKAQGLIEGNVDAEKLIDTRYAKLLP